MTTGSAGNQAAPAESFGRVDDSGTVFLRLPDGSERAVGQWAAGEPEKALTHYATKYADLVTEIDLAATRLADDRSTPAAAEGTVKKVRGALAEPAFVGDLSALVARVGQLDVLINVKKVALAEQKAENKEKALAARTELAEEAEKLADSQSWRATHERFTEMVEQWKQIPRVDKAAENDLWKRLSTSRTAFDKRRRAHYQQLEATRDEAKAAKEKLIKKAEELSTSKDWGRTTKAYRDLMDEWKKAGRAGKSDDALWARFRAAQDEFFKARNDVNAASRQEEEEALKVKLELLEQAEKLVPVTDPKAQRNTLRDIQEKWEKAGHIPRAQIRSVEGRMRKVEEAFRKADQERWKRSNPEPKTRADDTLARFTEAVEKYERALERAQESGDQAAISKAQGQVDNAKAMLALAESSSAKLR